MNVAPKTLKKAQKISNDWWGILIWGKEIENFVDLSMVAFSESMGSVKRSSRLSVLSSSASVATFLSSIRSTAPGIVVQSGTRGGEVPFSSFQASELTRLLPRPRLDLVTFMKRPKNTKTNRGNIRGEFQ